MLRIHGDGTLLRSLLQKAQHINAGIRTERSQIAESDENELQYQAKSATVANNSQSR